MAEISISDANAILKEDYGPDGIGNTAYEDNPTFAVLKKHRFNGKHHNFPVKYGYGSNRSRTAATALAKTNTTDYIEFEVPTVADFEAKSISLKALEEAQDENAFIDILKDTVDGVVQTLANNLGHDVFNHRGAFIGQINSAGAGSATITLKDPSDITKFYKGMACAVSATDGLTGSLLDNGDTVTITAVDRSAGTVTASTVWSTTINGAAADHYIFPAGDFGIGRAGFRDWVPDSAGGLGTAFYGATRSVDGSRLAGSRGTYTGMPISQAIRELAATIAREEGKPDTCVMSWATLNDLTTERDIKYVESRVNAQGMGSTIGFKTVKIIGPRGEIECMADRSCNDGRFYLFRRDKVVCIHSQSEPVKVMDQDGNMLSREANSFAFDVRGSSFANFAVYEPHHLGVGIL